MGKILAICDLEEKYIRKLTKYLSENQSIPFDIRAFTNINSLTAFAKEHSIEVLLISEQAVDESIHNLNINKIILLSDGTTKYSVHSYPVVFKYQSSGDLIREVLHNYMESGLGKSLVLNLQEKSNMIGIYSPIGRCLKTSLSLALAYQYSKQGKSLYIGLEEFSGLEQVLDGCQGAEVTNCLYYYRECPEESGIRVSVIAKEWEGCYVLLPPKYPEDIRFIQSEEWKGWLLSTKQAGFQTTILDIGHGMNGMEEVLKICDRIIMPVRADWMSQVKQTAFEYYLKSAGHEELWKKIEEVSISGGFPASKEEYKRFLTHGEMSVIAEHIVKRDR